MTVLDIFLGMRAVIIILELLLVARTWMVRGFCEVDECTLFLPVTSSQSSCKRARCTLAFEILQTPVASHIARNVGIGCVGMSWGVASGITSRGF